MKNLYIFLSCFIVCYTLYASQHTTQEYSSSAAIQDPSPVRRDLFSPVVSDAVEEVPVIPLFIPDNQLNEKLLRRVKMRDVIEIEKILSGYYAPHKFSIDYQDEKGKTPLIWAIELLGTMCPDTDMEKIINLLLEADADMTMQDYSGRSFVNYFLDNPCVAQETKDTFIKRYG